MAKCRSVTVAGPLRDQTRENRTRNNRGFPGCPDPGHSGRERFARSPPGAALIGGCFRPRSPLFPARMTLFGEKMTPLFPEAPVSAPAWLEPPPCAPGKRGQQHYSSGGSSGTGTGGCPGAGGRKRAGRPAGGMPGSELCMSPDCPVFRMQLQGTTRFCRKAARLCGSMPSRSLFSRRRLPPAPATRYGQVGAAELKGVMGCRRGPGKRRGVLANSFFGLIISQQIFRTGLYWDLEKNRLQVLWYSIASPVRTEERQQNPDTNTCNPVGFNETSFPANLR